MKIFLGLFITIILACEASAQMGGTLTGQVKQNGDPAVGITVTLSFREDSANKSVKTVTDQRGFYRFDGLQPFKYELIAEGEHGKGIAYRYPVEVEIGKEVRLDLELNMKDYAVFQSSTRFQESVTVSADRPQPMDEVSKTVDVITGQEMRDRGDITLVDSLRSIPGFRIQQLGGFGRTASIKTRGLRNQDTAVLIDGIRFRDAASITGDATPFLSDLTLTSVSRVEVLRGSGSSVYGTNAIGGVIDLQTPSPQLDWHGQVSGAVGALGLGRFRGNISRSFVGFGFTAGISRTVYTKGIDGDDDANNTNFQSRLNYQNKNSNLSVRIFASDAFVRLNSNPDTFGSLPPTNFGVVNASEGVNFIADVDDPDDIQRSKFFNGQLVFTQVGPKWMFQVFYSGLRTSRKNLTGPLGAGFQSASRSVFKGLIQTANAHFDWLPNNEHKLTAGYEFEHEKYGNDSMSAFSPDLSTLAKQSSHTFYVQYLSGFFGGRLQLAGGVRAQLFSLAKPRFTSISPVQNLTLDDPPTAYTFDGAASYLFRSAGTKFRAHVGNGYRIPSLFERFASFFGASHPNHLFLAGAPDLKPERSVAADAGIEQTFSNERVRLTATYFYTRLIDAIGFGTLPQPDRFGRLNIETFGGYLNTKGFIARGAEFSGRFRPGRWTDISASYTLTNSDQRGPQVGGSGVIDTLGIPNHQFTLVATQRVKRFWVNLDLLLASSYLAPIFSNTTFNSYVYRFRGNRRGDLTVGYNFSWKGDLNLRLFGTIENVFDDKYFENGFRTPGINARLGISFAF